MRIKTYTAATMQEAMDRIRLDMGPDAIIVTIDQGKAGVRVTAAIEPDRLPLQPEPAAMPQPERRPPAQTAPSRSGSGLFYDRAELRAILTHHGLPAELALRIEETARAFEASSLAEALSAALDSLLAFSAVPVTAPRPLALVGPPGAGKTVSVAKLAAESMLNGRGTHLATADVQKAMGAEQLSSYATRMKLKLARIDGPEKARMLAEAVSSRRLEGLTLLDTQGCNPFSSDDRARLGDLLAATNALPMLVLPAGLDPYEAADIGAAFHEMGARHLLMTRIEAARRLASVLTAARGGHLALAAFSASPYVADAIETATPLGLARLMTDLERTRAAFVKLEPQRAVP